MPRVTERDELMMRWFGTLRISNMEGLRWALAAAGGWADPVVLRQAQHWAARMEKLGLVERARLFGTGGSLVWATSLGVGRRTPNLLSQMTRHEVAVSIVAARYWARGFEWQRDRRPANKYDHQADGVAAHGDYRDAVEVELTAKRQQRYQLIFRAWDRRLQAGEIRHITYFTTTAAGRAVQTALAQSWAPASVRQRLRLVSVFDERGAWEGNEQPTVLGGTLEPAQPSPEGPADVPSSSSAITLDGVQA